MDYKQNAKYFEKVNMIPVIVGVVLALAGLITAFIGRSVPTTIIGLVLLIGGVICAISSVSGRLKGADLDAQAQKIYDSTLDTMYKRIDNFDMKFVKMYPPIVAGGYNYDGDVKIKEDGDGSTRSSAYKLVGMLFTENKMHVYENAFSFIDSDGTKESINTYKYDDIGEASVEEKQCDVPGSSKKYTYYLLHIALLKGGEILIPVKNDASTDEILNVINRRVASKKTQPQA